MFQCCLGCFNCLVGCFSPRPPKPDPFVESLPDGKQKKILQYVHVTSHYLDKSFCGIGLDPVIGLIPIVGDAVALFWAIALITYATQLGLPKDLIQKMVWNAVLDFGLGSIPVLGDIFDSMYRADIRNYKIMREYVKKQQKEAEQNRRREQSHLHRIEIDDSAVGTSSPPAGLTSPTPAYPTKPGQTLPPPTVAAAGSKKKSWWSREQPAPIAEMKVVKGSDTNV